MFDRAEFRAAVIRAGMTLEDLAREIGINPVTLYRKMNGNSDFSRSEMQNIRRILRLSVDDFERIFFAKQLA